MKAPRQAPVDGPVWGPWLANLPNGGVERELVTEHKRAEEVVAQILAHAGPVSFDLETAAPASGSALDPHTGYVRLAQFYRGGKTVEILDLRALGMDISVLAQLATRPLVTFAGVFECKWLLAAKLTFPLLEDAILAAGLRTDRDTHGRGDLVTIAKLCTDLDPPASTNKKQMQLSDFSGELSDEQLAYSAADVVMTLAVWERCTGEIIKAPKAYDAARGAILATARMELRGLPFDKAAHLWIADEWDRLRKIEALRFKMITDLDPTQRQAFGVWLENKLPPEILARWPRTDTKRLKLDSKRLKALGLADASPHVRQYMRANGLAALVSTFGHSLAKLINPVTQRLHFRLRIAGARTGRYASSEPNGQNMPGGPFRRVFAARPGRAMVSCDYAAVELRVAALLAREESLFEVFRERPLLEDGSRNPAGDPHVQLATGLQLPYDPKYRLAKNLNYGTIYGIGPAGFAVYAGITEQEARAHLGGWAKLRRKLVKWQQDTNAHTREKERAETILGRAVNCKIAAKRSKGRQVSPARVSLQRGLNVPVQGSAAEAMLIAVAKVDAALVEADRVEGIDAFLCVTVHDELVVEAAAKDADLAAEILADGMREGFKAVFGHLAGYDDVARYVVGGVDRGSTWGGKRFDHESLSEFDREILFKGLEELVVDESDEDDVDEDDDLMSTFIPAGGEPAPATIKARNNNNDDKEGD